MVSQTPESETKRRDISWLTVEVKCVKVGEADVSEETGVAHADGTVEIQHWRMTRARRRLNTRMGCLIMPIVESWPNIERVLDPIWALLEGGYIWAPRVEKGSIEIRAQDALHLVGTIRNRRGKKDS